MGAAALPALWPAVPAPRRARRRACASVHGVRARPLRGVGAPPAYRAQVRRLAARRRHAGPADGARSGCWYGARGRPARRSGAAPLAAPLAPRAQPGRGAGARPVRRGRRPRSHTGPAPAPSDRSAGRPGPIAPLLQRAGCVRGPSSVSSQSARPGRGLGGRRRHHRRYRGGGSGGVAARRGHGGAPLCGGVGPDLRWPRGLSAGRAFSLCWSTARWSRRAQRSPRPRTRCR